MANRRLTKMERDAAAHQATAERYRRILHAEAIHRVALGKAEIGLRIDIGGHGFWVEHAPGGGLIVTE